MTILDIKYWPDRFLRQVAEEIAEDQVQEMWVGQLIGGMFETMYDGRGLGLAATQVGVASRVIVIDTTPLMGSLKQSFVNPVITERTHKVVVSEEGCLSFPGVFAKVIRHEGVVVEHTGLTGETEEVILKGVDSVCFQHELDHLDGVVFFDYLKPAKKQMLDSKVRKNIKKIRRRRK